MTKESSHPFFSRVGSSIPGINKFITDIPQEAVKIIWQDDEENKGREIEFFPQSHMNLFLKFFILL
jgi:chemotaxis receptor (MCP) glutamine deamidase CheD